MCCLKQTLLSMITPKSFSASTFVYVATLLPTVYLSVPDMVYTELPSVTT